MNSVTPALLKLRARFFRNNATDAEAKLWAALRNRRLGVKFRRQHPFPPYILDFYCHAARLVIELDGNQHAQPAAQAYDAARTDFLQQNGLEVVRFPNAAVLQDLDAVLWSIQGLVSERLLRQ